MSSDRKASAIYGAVHHEMVELRIALKRNPAKDFDTLDYRIAQAADRAATAAVKAYRTRLRSPRPAGEE